MRARGAGGRHLAVPLLGLLVLGAACASSRTFQPNPGRYDVLAEPDLQRARDARRMLENGSLRRAQEVLTELLVANPRHIPLAILQQDVYLALLRAGRAVALEGVTQPEAPLSEEEACARLRPAYLRRAEAGKQPEFWVVAARLAPDPETALADLLHVVELDPDCVWLHYARAHASFRLRDFPAVRASITRALALDPAHLPTLRLEATLLSEATELEEAEDVLLYWLEACSESPFVDPRSFAEAQVDLAQLFVLDDEPGEALDVLAAVDSRFLASDAVRARAKLVRAAALQAEGDSRGTLLLALGAAQEAERLSPNALLPLVDQATLQGRLNGVEAEREVWERLLERAAAERKMLEGLTAEERAERLEFLDLLYELEARTRLARIAQGDAGAGSPRP